MLQKKEIWFAFMGAIVLLYLGGIVMLAQGNLGHPLFRISVIVLIAHVLEMPLAFRALRDRNPQWPRAIGLTLLFGLAWWLPAKRGIFAVR